MDITNFRASLEQDAYAEIETKSLAADKFNAEHEHPFDVRALVLDGEIALTVARETRSYRKGEIFSLAAGCRHAEQVGAAGVSYIVGRRRAGAR
ncbi:MAG: cupin domain-containing protein [Burkholderiales bacterium]